MYFGGNTHGCQEYSKKFAFYTQADRLYFLNTSIHVFPTKMPISTTTLHTLYIHTHTATVPRPAKSWKCPAFCTKSDFFARVQFVTLPRCPDINANHPIERNYGNSVRFLAKIQNGTAAESPCYSVFWNAIDLCRLYTSKKNLNVGPANRPAFCRQVPLFFTRNVPLKTFSRLAGLRNHDAIVVLAPPAANFGSM